MAGETRSGFEAIVESEERVPSGCGGRNATRRERFGEDPDGVIPVRGVPVRLLVPPRPVSVHEVSHVYVRRLRIESRDGVDDDAGIRSEWSRMAE